MYAHSDDYIFCMNVRKQGILKIASNEFFARNVNSVYNGSLHIQSNYLVMGPYKFYCLLFYSCLIGMMFQTITWTFCNIAVFIKF